MRLPIHVNPRIAVVVVHDIVMAAIAMELAIWARYWLADLRQPLFFLWEGTALFTVIAAAVFAATGLYRGIWHYASFRDLVAIVRAVALAVLIFVPLLFLLTRLDDFPRSVLVFVGPLLVVMLAAPRLMYRAWKDGNLRHTFERSADKRVPVLLVGAGQPAETFIRAMTGQKHAGYRVVGMVDDNPKRQGRDIHGIRVFGELDTIPALVDRLARAGNRPQRLIIAAQNLDGAKVEQLLEIADRLGLVLARLPRLTDFQRGEADAAPRPIDVEDLLGRPQRVLDRSPVSTLIAGRCVLITGAGGTIGGELCRQIAALGPRRLVLFENSEHNLYQIDLELAEQPEIVPRRAVLGDVRDARRLARIFAEERPDIVFHAAAFKHVPLVEMNPNEAVLTNAIGTRLVAEACLAHGTATMVLISTDKAVNPTNVMGATKRVAEMVMQTAATGSGAPSGAPLGETRFVAVRFGNVLGSTGSVVPLFQRQLARGGPLTVTHPDVTRFFMTVREAVELILQAAARPDLTPQRSGAVFVLDMGRAVRILDLARQMIRLSGRQPDKEVAIVFTGLRPGEKLHEEVMHPEEQGRQTAVDGVLLGGPRSPDRDSLWSALDALAEAAGARDTARAMELLCRLVPEFAGDAANWTIGPGERQRD